MRPEILFPIFAPITTLPGVGPHLAKSIERLAGGHIVDLFWHLPSGLIDRRFAPKIADAIPGEIGTITVNVDTHHPAHNRRMPYKITCSDETGTMALVFFHARAEYLIKILPKGETRVVSGKIELFGDELQMTHPDHVGTPQEMEQLQAIEPVYSLTQGLSLKVLNKAIRAALAAAPNLPEWLDGPYRDKNHWPSWHEALQSVHAPNDFDDLNSGTPARERLTYDELLANQLSLALVRANLRRQPGRAIAGDESLRAKLTTVLPFSLTPSQDSAIKEILADMAEPKRMHRLLQGDVGSGKTVVALLCMLAAVEISGQAALLAPTEILARQHFATISEMALPLGLEIALLTGRERGKNRDKIVEALANGRVNLAIGTHALFQEEIKFDNLMLAVIDEQHRFGVHQRLQLTAKGKGVDVLVMTATPIPRTLMLTVYGDMEVSRLLEKPAGRQPIDTRAMALNRLDEIIQSIQRVLSQGAQVYWVCPLVEESESVDLAAAEDRYAHLTRVLDAPVGLVHGRMKGKEKDDAMAGFGAGTISVLVATTVIEVGVDVPNATVMVVEHAERFGLAQLHQLRGRIGRDKHKSTCLLLYAPDMTAMARARIQILRETDDGFRIAEEDLRLRGAGELMGTRQSGLPNFRLADLSVHDELLAAARDDARLIIEMDPELTGPRGMALRVLLYLFERDAAVKYLRSG